MRFQAAFVAVVALTTSMVIAEDNLDESKAIAKIELLGGKVWKDRKLPRHPVIEVDFQKSIRFNEKHLHLLKSFQKLQSLNLLGKSITDIGVMEISELKSLKELWIYNDQITNDALKKLKGSLPKTKVNLVGRRKMRFTGEAANPTLGVFVIDSLKNFQLDSDNITMLELSDTKTTNDDLRQLRQTENLTTLNLSDNQITDEGLSDIGGLKNLTKLALASTRISP